MRHIVNWQFSLANGMSGHVLLHLLNQNLICRHWLIIIVCNLYSMVALMKSSLIATIDSQIRQ